MTTKKYIVLCIVFLIVMPCKIILGQDIADDTAVQSPLDIKYDSILAKAASSLTASAYQQSIDYYKQASALKPGETYAYKMINYVQDLAAKQKRSDDLKRRIQIKTAMMRANQAIEKSNWDTAKALFSEVLTLRPEKTEEEYAKAKVASVDLELKRIAARIPVKAEPPVIIPPKNRREARAQRKLAERNATLLASASNKEIAQRQLQSKADAAFIASAKAKKNIPTSQGTSTSAANTSTSAANTNNTKKIDYQLLQNFNEDFKNVSNVNWTINSQFAKADFLQDDQKVEAFYDLDNKLIGTSRYISIDELPRETKRILTTKYPQYIIKEVMRYEGADEIAYYITTEDDKEKVVFKITGARDIAVFYRERAEKNGVTYRDVAKVIPTKPTYVAPAQKKGTGSVDSSKAKGIQPKAIQTETTAKNTAITSANNLNKPVQIPVRQISLPEKKAARPIDLPKTIAIQQKPVQTPPPAKSAAIAASSAKDTNKAMPQKPIQVPAATNQSIALSSSSARPVLQKPAETRSLAKNEVISPAPGKIQQAPPTAGNGVIARPLSDKEIHQRYLESLKENDTTNASPKDNQQKPAQPLYSDGAITASADNEIPLKTMDGRPVKLSDSSNYVKLICQDISFIGSNAYIKVLIQNYSETTNFSTDTLHVSIKKNNGVIKKLDQRFISNFPVILPLKESVLVSFADASANIEPDDIFILEMQDRVRKTKLTVQVPWSVYNQNKNL